MSTIPTALKVVTYTSPICEYAPLVYINPIGLAVHLYTWIVRLKVLYRSSLDKAVAHFGNNFYIDDAEMLLERFLRASNPV